jgi:threo-3-hydroxy-L-aspartate ammonia-lyase
MTTTFSSLEAVVRRTTIIDAPRLVRRLGIDVRLASETFQHTGSFKFRAAYNLASHVPHELLIAASSGNFGQALAYACSLLKKSLIVVMPATSAKVKVDAVRQYGGRVELIDVRVKSRAQRVAELAKRHPEAYLASPYDDPLVIEGNSSLGRELVALQPAPDVVVAPVGGGGLSSGIISGIKQCGSRIKVIGAEPLLGNDAARSLRAGRIIANKEEPRTIADGARTISLGKLNWKILRHAMRDIVEVPEEKISEATRLLFELANLKAEPTGALSIAALMTHPKLFYNRSVCCVISGANVDSALYKKILG